MSFKAIFNFNAGISFPFALLLLAVPELISGLVMLPVWLIVSLGVFLVAFSTSGWLVGKNQHITGAKVISVLDILWVTGSFLLALINPFGMAILGQVLVIVAALPVAFCAWQQLSAIKQLNIAGAV